MQYTKDHPFTDADVLVACGMNIDRAKSFKNDELVMTICNSLSYFEPNSEIEAIITDFFKDPSLTKEKRNKLEYFFVAMTTPLGYNDSGTIVQFVLG